MMPALLSRLAPMFGASSLTCAAARSAIVRGGKPKYADVCTFNSTGKPQARMAMDHCRKGKFVGPLCPTTTVPVAAILGQEHHCAGHEWVDFKGEARKTGWTLTGAAAISNKSAGASLAVRSIYHSGLTKGAREDCSPKESPGRLATGWIDGVLKRGL